MSWESGKIVAQYYGIYVIYITSTVACYPAGASG